MAVMKHDGKTYEILGLDGNTLSVNGSQVGVLEEGDEVRLGGLLEGHDGGGLEAEIRLEPHTVNTAAHIPREECTNLEVLGDLTDETLEGELADQQLGGLLVATDFTESDGTGPETMGLLHTASGGGLWGDVAR